MRRQEPLLRGREEEGGAEVDAREDAGAAEDFLVGIANGSFAISASAEFSENVAAVAEAASGSDAAEAVRRNRARRRPTRFR